MPLRPHGTSRLVGQMLGMRAFVPLEGAAGGMPGATTELLLHRAGVEEPERVSTAAAGVVLNAGDTFEIRCASGGGVGDPFYRDAGVGVGDAVHWRFTSYKAFQ